MTRSLHFFWVSILFVVFEYAQLNNFLHTKLSFQHWKVCCSEEFQGLKKMLNSMKKKNVLPRSSSIICQFTRNISYMSQPVCSVSDILASFWLVTAGFCQEAHDLDPSPTKIIHDLNGPQQRWLLSLIQMAPWCFVVLWFLSPEKIFQLRTQTHHLSINF